VARRRCRALQIGPSHDNGLSCSFSANRDEHITLLIPTLLVLVTGVCISRESSRTAPESFADALDT
jgi:hypothetical protein